MLQSNILLYVQKYILSITLQNCSLMLVSQGRAISHMMHATANEYISYKINEMCLISIPSYILFPATQKLVSASHANLVSHCSVSAACRKISDTKKKYIVVQGLLDCNMPKDTCILLLELSYLSYRIFVPRGHLFVQDS